MNIGKFVGIACLSMGLSGQAMAAYVPGTLLTPNPLQPQNKILVLKNSVVDLVHNIEILNFHFTQEKSVCDIYKGLTATLLSQKHACLNSEVAYTNPVVTASDGWRIGGTRNMLDFIELFPGWWRPASWLTIFNVNRTAMDVISDTLGSTRIVDGKGSFALVTSDGIAGSNQSVVTLDELNYTGGDTGYRISQSGNYASVYSETSVLMVRDWTGVERPIHSTSAVPSVAGGLGLIGLMCLLRRREHGGCV